MHGGIVKMATLSLMMSCSFLSTIGTGYTGAPWEPMGNETMMGWKAVANPLSRPKFSGEYYEAEVPDTLDLAERARYGVNHFTSIISPENNYEMYWGTMACNYGNDFMSSLGRPDWTQWGYSFGQTNPPVINLQFSPLMACQPKCMEALAMERLMCGSQQNLVLEGKMLEMMASLVDADGLYCVPKDQKKWWLGPDEYRPYAHTHGQARMLRAMIAWFQYTEESKWKELVDRMVEGLDKFMVVHKEDYGYIPTQGFMPIEYFRSCYVKGMGWRNTEEPTDEKSGEEGSLFCHQGHTPGVLANWYRFSGNRKALDLSGELVRFYTKPQFWADNPGGEYPGTVGAEHAHWQGHFHGYVNVLTAILEYAIATNDVRLKQFVRDGYEWARQSGIASIGLAGDGQGCGVGRLIGLAIKLSEAGIGDYWEDVDLYIRNQGTEMQFVPEDLPYLRNLCEGKPEPPFKDSCYHAGDDVFEMNVGGFSEHFPGKSGTAGCCSPWGNMGLFYAWDGTLRQDNGTVRINLLLNRASSWMDVDSYLPYEGKVVLKNKSAKEAFVRIPLWVEMDNVQCLVNNHQASPSWFGNYLRIRDLAKNDIVIIRFPLKERVETWTSPPQGPFNLLIQPGIKHTLRFKGNTLIEINPPISGSPLYRNRKTLYESNILRMHKVTRFVTPFILKW